MGRSLQLARPLVAFDLETTGLDVEQDRIVELSLVKLLPDGERQVRTRRIHPGRPIPPEATAVHGIGDADVADCPRFGQVARSLAEWLRGCDLTGYNIERFDLRLLAAEFKRENIEWPEPGTQTVDAFVIFAKREPRDLAAALRYYCDRELVGAHSAEADTLASLDVLLGQIRKYEDLPDTVAGLHEYTHARDPSWIDASGKLVWNADNQAAIGFGKYKGKALSELMAIDPGYLRWMLSKDFGDDVKAVLAQALERRYPERPPVVDKPIL